MKIKSVEVDFFVVVKKGKQNLKEKNNVKGQTLKIMYLFCNLLCMAPYFYS